MHRRIFLASLISLTLVSTAYAGIMDYFYKPTQEPILGGGTGTIQQLDQWKSTSTPETSITQNIYGRAVRLTGKLLDLDGDAGTNGQVLQTTGTGTQWVATSTLGISSGGGTWGSITGTLSDQTDLQTALNAKVDGSGTTNEIPYWVDSNTLGSLTTATYPSLTELSYGKGVTSSIQTQLNSKGTFTLPSLTSGSVLFSNGTTIAQDNANLFWNDTNNRLGLGTTTPAYTLDLQSTGNIQAWIGTQGSTFGYTLGRNTGTGFLDITGNQGGFSGIHVDQIKSDGAITIGGNAVISNWASRLGIGNGSGTPIGYISIQSSSNVDPNLTMGGGSGSNYTFRRDTGTGYLMIAGQQGQFTGYRFDTGQYSDIFTMINGAGAVFNETGESVLDFRIESDTDANNFFVDASADANGFGTSTPAAKVHIIKTTEQLRVGYDTSNYFKTTVGSTGGATFDAVGSGANFSFADNIGIATTTPGYALTVAGDISLTGALRANGNAGTSGMVLQTTGTGTQWVATSSLGISGGSSVTGSTGQVPYFSGTDTAVGTSSLYIATSGNVGVGTTTPWATLAIDSSNGRKFSIGNNAANLTTSFSVASSSPSYSNSGGTGDRTSTITVTTDLTISGGSMTSLVDGANGSGVLWVSVQDNTNKYIRFDFGSSVSKKIIEAKYYQLGTYTHGTWKWQGSNNASSWTDIGSDFTLGTSGTQTITTLSGNTLGYRYYQIVGTGGNTTNAPYLYEFEFKLDDYIGGSDTYAVQQVYTDVGTAGGTLSLQKDGGSVAIGTVSTLSKLDVNGNMALGSYAGINAAPTNGLIVSGNVGVGTASPSAQLHVLKTTEQLRVGYDASNYYSTTIGSTGGVTLDAVGSGAGFTFSDSVQVPRGGASTKAKVGGTIFDYFTDASVGGAETDIYSSTLDASLFATNGDKVTSSYGGNFVTVGTELTQLKVVLAGTTIWDSTGVAPTTGTTSWNVDVKLIRVSSTVIRYTVTLNTTGASGFVYAVSGELTGLTLTNTNILKLTGTSSGVGSGAGDIVGKMGFVEYKPNA